MKEPKITKFGYKLFESKDGITLQPLFIDKKEIFPIGEWIEAKNIEYHPNFSHRPGIHVGCNLPSAVWLMDANGKYKSRFKNGQRELEFILDKYMKRKNAINKLPQNNDISDYLKIGLEKDKKLGKYTNGLGGLF